MRKTTFQLLVFFSLIISITGCAAPDRIPATGRLHDYPIQTTVDHTDARYYLENHLANRPGNPALDNEIKSIHDRLDGRVPTRKELQTLSENHSVDFAALVFGDQLLKQPENDRIQKVFLNNFRRIKDGSIELPHMDTLVLLVPGYDYVESGRFTGADLAQPRRLIASAGYEVLFIEVDPFGTVEENAAVISAAIVKNKNRKMVISGPSSAGPTIHLSLGKLLQPEHLQNMKAWLNLGGILRGSPVIDQVSSGVEGGLFSMVIWYKDWRRESFDSMTTEVSRKRFAGLKIPPHIRIINYIGLSLSGDISENARDKYLLMRKDGPNDGLTLLPDAIAPNSVSILAPASDHYFAEDPEIDAKTLALLVTLLGEI